jgi:hypothetical protein
MNILTLHVHNAKFRSELCAYLIHQQEDTALFVLRVWWELHNISECSDREARNQRARAVWEKFFVPTICARLPPGYFLNCRVDNLVSSTGCGMLETVGELKRECIKFVETRIKAGASPRSITAMF